MMGLTPLQLSAFRFIADFIEHQKVAPTIEEIRKGIGSRSRGHVHKIVEALIERGYVRHLPNKARALEIVAKAQPITLSPDIDQQVSRYATEHKIARNTAVNELLRLQFGDAA